jgi:hypothetical protein
VSTTINSQICERCADGTPSAAQDICLCPDANAALQLAASRWQCREFLGKSTWQVVTSIASQLAACAAMEFLLQNCVRVALFAWHGMQAHAGCPYSTLHTTSSAPAALVLFTPSV